MFCTSAKMLFRTGRRNSGDSDFGAAIISVKRSVKSRSLLFSAIVPSPDRLPVQLTVEPRQCFSVCRNTPKISAEFGYSNIFRFIFCAFAQCFSLCSRNFFNCGSHARDARTAHTLLSSILNRDTDVLLLAHTTSAAANAMF